MQRIFSQRTQPCDTGESVAATLLLTNLELGALARRSALENEHFRSGQAHDPRYAHELFRRAIVEQCQAAWCHIYEQYAAQVERWVLHCPALAQSGESSDYFVPLVFARFWRAVTPERFGTFPSLATLLRYMRLCSSSVVIDSVRVQSWAPMLPEEALGYGRTPAVCIEDDALDRVQGEEFWRVIDAHLHDERERVAIHGLFVLGMSPRVLVTRHSDLFEDVTTVYGIRRNVLKRLERNTQLRRFMAA